MSLPRALRESAADGEAEKVSQECQEVWSLGVRHRYSPEGEELAHQAPTLLKLDRNSMPQTKMEQKEKSGIKLK